MKSNPVELVANYLREHSGTTIANVAVGKAIGEIRHHASDDTYSYVCTVEGTVRHVSYDFRTREGAERAAWNACRTWQTGKGPA